MTRSCFFFFLSDLPSTNYFFGKQLETLIQLAQDSRLLQQFDGRFSSLVCMLDVHINPLGTALRVITTTEKVTERNVGSNLAEFAASKA